MKTEEKTIEEHFMSFKDPKIWALSFCNTLPEVLKQKTPCIRTALTAAFIWYSTPQGSLFWRTIWNMEDPLLANYSQLKNLI